jgi:hypothetical protein
VLRCALRRATIRFKLSSVDVSRRAFRRTTLNVLLIINARILLRALSCGESFVSIQSKCGVVRLAVRPLTFIHLQLFIMIKCGT